MSDRLIERRNFVMGVIAGSAAAGFAPFTAFGGGVQPSPRSLTLAMQGYCLHRFHVHALMEAAAEFGVDTLELFDRQMSVFMSDRDLETLRTQREEAGMGIPATYTDLFSADPDANERILAFGQRAGLRFVSCTPDERTAEILNDLLADHDIGIAVHNTSPGPDETLVTLRHIESLLDRHERLGACLDVGNIARARIDPVEAIRALRGRILEVHLKDVRPDGRAVTLGDGALDMPAIIGELRDAEFGGLLTIEHADKSGDINGHIDDLRTGLERARRWLA